MNQPTHQIRIIVTLIESNAQHQFQKRQHNLTHKMNTLHTFAKNICGSVFFAINYATFSNANDRMIAPNISKTNFPHFVAIFLLRALKILMTFSMQLLSFAWIFNLKCYCNNLWIWNLAQVNGNDHNLWSIICRKFIDSLHLFTFNWWIIIWKMC